MSLNSQNLFKFARFGITGAGIGVLDLALIWLLQKVLPPLIAISLAYFLAVAVHFCLNKWWVFQDGRRDYTRQLGRYVLTVLLCWVTTIGIVSLVTTLGQTNLILAKVWAIPPTTLLGFLLMRGFVFQRLEGQTNA